MKLAIVTVNWNCPHFLEVQLPLIKRHIKPDGVYVVDTSTDDNLNKAIASNCGASYARLTVTHDYSQSHATALNFAYQYLRKKYDVIGFLDHDCFPVTDFNVIDELGTHNFLAVDQIRNDVLYPHPGYLFMRTCFDFVDFMPSPDFGLDTAGLLWPIYKEVKRMTYQHRGGYEFIHGRLIHIVKGSVWNNDPETKQRVNEVFEHVKSYI